MWQTLSFEVFVEPFQQAQNVLSMKRTLHNCQQTTRNGPSTFCLSPGLIESGRTAAVMDLCHPGGGARGWDPGR